MKYMLIILSCLLSYSSQAESITIEDGVYYSYWVRGDIGNYKITDTISNKPNKIGQDYYLINNIDEGSNNEVYMLVQNGNVKFFYKHDEIEGGPSIGWGTAKLIDNKLYLDFPTVKNFYDDTNGDADRSIKYKIGSEFSENDRPGKEKEVIPLQKINPKEYKVDCLAYFDENMKYNKTSYPKDDAMKNYSKKVLINNNSLCNLILDKK